MCRRRRTFINLHTPQGQSMASWDAAGPTSQMNMDHADQMITVDWQRSLTAPDSDSALRPWNMEGVAAKNAPNPQLTIHEKKDPTCKSLCFTFALFYSLFKKGNPLQFHRRK